MYAHSHSWLFFPPAEAPVFPHQEQGERSLHVDPGRRGGDEIRTSGGDPGSGAHERHLVLSGRPPQEQGTAWLKGLHVSSLALGWPNRVLHVCPVCCSCPQP